jgi:hypothetical protein
MIEDKTIQSPKLFHCKTSDKIHFYHPTHYVFCRGLWTVRTKNLEEVTCKKCLKEKNNKWLKNGYAQRRNKGGVDSLRLSRSIKPQKNAAK